MLAIQNKQLNSIFERIVKDHGGSFIRVRFTVIEVNGVFQPQIISAESIIFEVKSEVICLPCIKDSLVISEDYTPSFISKISPYFSLDFLMSQPTRAPANR
jgi:hypothetical protein